MNHGRLYQVELQPIEGDPSVVGTPTAGNVIVGQELSETRLQDLKHLLGGEVAFTSQGRMLASTLYPFQEKELTAQLYGKISLHEGFRGTADWYKSAGWL